MLSCCALQFHWNFVLGFFPHGIKFYTEPRKRGAWRYIALISVKVKETDLLTPADDETDDDEWVAGNKRVHHERM